MSFEIDDVTNYLVTNHVNVIIQRVDLWAGVGEWKQSNFAHSYCRTAYTKL